jgi:hypothetical protein
VQKPPVLVDRELTTIEIEQLIYAFTTFRSIEQQSITQLNGIFSADISQ